MAGRSLRYFQSQHLESTKTMDPQIVSSIITGLSIIAATIVGSITALVLALKISQCHKLRQDLNQAVGDIHFLLAVEEAHCERNKSREGETFKLRTRSVLRDKVEADFTGRFTPGNWKTDS